MRENGKEITPKSTARFGEHSSAMVKGKLNAKTLELAIAQLAIGLGPIIIDSTFINCTYRIISEESGGEPMKLFLGE